MNFIKIKVLSIISLAMLTAVPAIAQDKLAHQVNADKSMNSIDALELQKIMLLEEFFAPSNYLYSDWNNKYAHAYGECPDTFKIDLRGFCMPTTSRKLTSNYGPRWGRQHKGLDIKVYVGDTIRSAFSGRVRVVRTEPRGYGKFIVIRHDNGLETVYGHLSKHLCRENQVVRAGDVIGLGGNTGRSTGSHLHFETRLCGIALHPAIMFDFYNQDVTADYYLYIKKNYNRDLRAANNRVMATINVGSVYSDSYAAAPRRTHSNTNDVAVNTSKPQQNTSVEVEPVPDKSRTTESIVQTSTGFHKVAAGETLYSIARHRGTTVDNMCKLNHIGKDFKVIPGQILRY